MPTEISPEFFFKKGENMKREIKGMIFFIKEAYKTTLAIEGKTYSDLAKFLLTLKKRGYSKPSIYLMTFSGLKTERISYKELSRYLKDYTDNEDLIKKFKKRFM